MHVVFMSILYCFTMSRPPKRKVAYQKVSRDMRGRFNRGELDFINTEASTLEIAEMGLCDDLLSEQLWENDEVSDWGSDVDSEAEQDIFTYRLLWKKNYISTTGFSGSKIGFS